MYTFDVDMLLSLILKDENETKPIIGIFLSSQQYATLYRKKKNKSIGVSGKWIKLLHGFAKHGFANLLLVK